MKKAKTNFPTWHIHGFTLVELMATISILAILATIAIPSYNSMIRRNQIQTTTSDLLTTLSLAKSEATKRGTNVSVCPSNGANGCSASRNWNTGWLVFTDTGVLGTIDGTDTILTNTPATNPSVSIVATELSATYTPTGPMANYVSPPQDASLVVSKSGCGNGELRTITIITMSGRNQVRKGDCP